MVKTRDNNKNYYSKFNRGSYSRGSSARGRNSYYSRRGYSRNNGKYFQNHWNRFPPGHNSRPLSRPVSPVEGSEEFMARKIQQTSANIMRQLLSPNEAVTLSPAKTLNTDMDNRKDMTRDMRKTINESIKQNEKSPSKTKKICTKEINVKEIHEKILNRITNLNEGRKKNFINAHSSTSLDSAVQHIHKQKRLEISRVLRDMCSSSQNLQKSGDLIDSIITDIEIKLEELPIDVIQELRQTLSIDFDEDVLHPDSLLDNSHISITSDELNAAIDSIQDTTERVDLVNNSCESIEIKAEDIVDFGLEDINRCSGGESGTSHTVAPFQESEPDQEELVDPIHHSFTIKEEPIEEGRDCDSPGTFSQSTVLNRYNPTRHVEPDLVERNESFSNILNQNNHRNHVEPDLIERNKSVGQTAFDNELEIHDEEHADIIGNTPIFDRRESNCSQTNTHSVSYLENCIRQFIHSNSFRDIGDNNEVFVIVESIQKCVSNLSEHGRNLMKAVVDRYKNQNSEGIGISHKGASSNNSRRFSDQSSQTDRNNKDRFVVSKDEDRRVTKRRKEGLSDQEQNLLKAVPVRCLGNINREGIGISQNDTSSNNARRVCDQSSQVEVQTIACSVTSEDDDKSVTKRRKKEHITQEIINEYEIKCEVDTEKLLVFPKFDDQVTVVEQVDNRLVIATKSGNIIYASLKDGIILHRIDVSESPITSLIFLPWKSHSISMYVGSLDRALRMYDLRSGNIQIATHVDDQILCMDAMWGYVFMGCRGGMLIRYSTKSRKIEFEERNSSADILVLKAGQEGPRRVLLIGHKQAPVYVRDAMSGQYLRNFSNEAISPTVYSLIVNKSHLYCGTAQDNILVFSFHEGALLHRLVAAHCKGISCMKIYQELLFSGCYNGMIYVHHLKLKKLLKVLKGPGGSISCMEVLRNQVIVGTLKGEFGSVEIPADIIAYGRPSTPA